MENTETMDNEIIEATTTWRVVPALSKGSKIAAGIGVSVVVGYVAYKYVIRPVVVKIKAEIEQKKAAAAEHGDCGLLS